MLFDVLIRLLATIELSIIFNAEGITTASVAMSICAFFLMELSLLSRKRFVTYLSIIAPFLFTILWILFGDALTIEAGAPLFYFERKEKLLLLLLFGLNTMLSSILYEMVQTYQSMLHRTRDDSKELEEMLRNQNIQILKNQDNEINMATLRERNRIAREIHDNVGHMLSRAILLLGAINTVNTDEHIKPQLTMLANTLDESMQKMRKSVHDLHDDSIDISRTFQEMITELEASPAGQHFQIQSTLDFNEEIPKHVKLALIGILQESLTNAIKHSNGDRITIILRENPTFCTLSVIDNGNISEDTIQKIQTESQDGIGLNNIRERAKACGGDANFYTNQGFTVFVRLPYPNNK